MWANCQRFSKRILGTFLQAPCSICSRNTASLFCKDCEKQIQGYQLLSPYGQESSAVPSFAWGAYSGTLKRAIQVLKYHDAPEIAVYLGNLLGQVWLQKGTAFLSSSSLTQAPGNRCRTHTATNLVVVPVPLHHERLKERGYNQAAMIAQGFCKITQLPCLEKGLLRIRGTEAQYRLGAQARQKNLNGAFRLGPDWTIAQMSSAVLLIDDIYTTGTTANAAATELRRNGLRVVGIGVAARAIRERPESKKSEAKQPLQRQRSTPRPNP